MHPMRIFEGFHQLNYRCRDVPKNTMVSFCDDFGFSARAQFRGLRIGVICGCGFKWFRGLLGGSWVDIRGLGGYKSPNIAYYCSYPTYNYP